MIYAYSALSGYSCLIGSFRVRIPMLVAMILFIQVPQSEGNSLAISKQTYVQCFCMHLILSFVDMAAYSQGVVFLSSFFEAFQTSMVVFQVLNLVTLITYYDALQNNRLKVEMGRQDFQVFALWIVIELNMIIFLIAANILAMFF